MIFIRVRREERAGKQKTGENIRVKEREGEESAGEGEAEGGPKKSSMNRRSQRFNALSTYSTIELFQNEKYW